MYQDYLKKARDTLEGMQFMENDKVYSMLAFVLKEKDTEKDNALKGKDIENVISLKDAEKDLALKAQEYESNLKSLEAYYLSKLLFITQRFHCCA